MRKYIVLVLLLATGCKGINRAVDRLTGGGEASKTVYNPCAAIAPVNISATDSAVVALYTFDQRQWFDKSSPFYDPRSLSIVQQYYAGLRAYPTASGGLLCIGTRAEFDRAVVASAREGILDVTL